MKKFIVCLLVVLMLFQASAQFGYDDPTIPLIKQQETSDAGDLLPLDNTWTGTNTFEGDVTFDGEVYGTPVALQVGSRASRQLDSTGGTNVRYMYNVGEVGVLETTNKGMVMEKAGSIAGWALMYDVTATTGSPLLTSRMSINGNPFVTISQSCSVVVANEQTCIASFPRDTYTFNAGDDLEAFFRLQGFQASTLDFEDVIWTIYVYQDA